MVSIALYIAMLSGLVQLDLGGIFDIEILRFGMSIYNIMWSCSGLFIEV